ncbi:MAG: 50S ribosomal protein L6 [Candidatus Brocadiia bacterium]|nr:50S ribosomal protein L6 [Candidatus Brocadiia bacterium]
MSNMNKPIECPAGVEVTLAGSQIRIKGPLGELSREFPDEIQVEYDEAARLIGVARKAETRQARSLHGLYRSLINNMALGVTQGFRKDMAVVGTGYQIRVRDNDLVLQIGFSHEVVMPIPEGLRVEVSSPMAQPDNPARFAIHGTDKELVGQFAAEVRSVRPPEPYKGKGIRYTDEHVRRKEGKAFAGAG